MKTQRSQEILRWMVLKMVNELLSIAISHAFADMGRERVNDEIPADVEELKALFPYLLEKYGRWGVKTPGSGISFNGGIEDYARSFKLDIPGMIDRRLDEQQVVRVGDVGCSTSRFLKELKVIFGERVEVVGFELGDHPTQKGLDEFVKGDFERIDLAAKHEGIFDFVFSRQALRYFENPLGLAYRKARD